jgi:segregation and condensation protein B
MQQETLQKVVDAILLSAEEPLTINKLLAYFDPEECVNRDDIKQALALLKQETSERGFELTEVASGFRYQTREEYKYWVSKHWQERAPRYSRAFLETLALIVYRQPVRRAEIEEVRGVAVSSNIIKTLLEREWVRVVGHKELPGRPAMLGTTRQFLDYFNLKSLDEMPPLADLQDIDQLYPELNTTLESEKEQQIEQKGDEQGQMREH